MKSNKSEFIRVDPQTKANLKLWKALKGHKTIDKVIKEFIPQVKIPSNIGEENNEKRKKSPFFPKI